ncbi:MAG: putative sulfate/molybdate transporter [Acidiferrobacterales bacterium]
MKLVDRAEVPTDKNPQVLSLRLPRFLVRNRFNRHEWAGAFADLGTLIPFVVGYLSVVGMEPGGVLFGFGAAMLVSGMVYGTPFPVQPMKAIGAVATAQTSHAIITPATVGAAGLLTGALWFLLGMTGMAKRLREWVSDSVGAGIVIGLALSLFAVGTKMLAGDWVVGFTTLVVTLLLLRQTVVPVMFLLLVSCAIVALVQDHSLAKELAMIQPRFDLPSSSLGILSWNDISTALLLLVLPQLPLTLGNAVVATARENNRLFPKRVVSEKKLMLSTGVMNVGSAMLGGVPMCHGAGGMAAHVRFGARTGGAPIILGAILLVLALFFSSSIQVLFRMFPLPILGVILMLAAVQLASGPWSVAKNSGNREKLVIAATVLVCLWNVGAGFLAGLLLDQGTRFWWRRRETQL